MRRLETIVVSDLHLGARNARAEAFLRFLEWIDKRQTSRLILAGDVFEFPCLKKLNSTHVRVLEALRWFARSHSLTWIKGNHDPSHDYFSGVLGVESRDETVIEAGPSSRYLVCHGHKWDPSMRLPQWIIAGADAVYLASQSLDRSHHIARWLKRRCKRFVRAIDSLEQKAVAEARHRGLTGVIVGHSHVARDCWRDGVHFLNSGCWTEQPASFVGISDGLARQYFWDLELAQPSDLAEFALPAAALELS